MNEKLLSTDRPIELYYALLSDIISYLNVGKSQCTVVLSGEWNLINTTIGTINLKETPQGTAAGEKFTTELAAICPGHNESIVESIDSILGKKVILKAVFCSGEVKIIGNSQTGPKLYIATNSNRITERRLQSSWEHLSQNRYHT